MTRPGSNPIPVFQQNVIAIVWDFDRTLIRGNMQAPLFEEYGIDPQSFWGEVDTLAGDYREQGIRVARGSAYLNHILSYAWAGRFQGLSNEKLNGYGDALEFYEGMPQFLEHLATAIADEPRYRRHEITVEHYIVSTGLRQIIEGSPVRRSVQGVWASEFIEEPIGARGRMQFVVDDNLPLGGPPTTLTQIGYALEDTTKTRALFEINKGVNVEPGIDVNDVMQASERRVPFSNMICVADGPSDVPMFSVLKQLGGKNFAVYDPLDGDHFDQVSRLVEQERVIASFPADYTEGSPAWRWLHRAAKQIADDIVERREAALQRARASGPRHVPDQPAGGPQNGSGPDEQ